MEPTIYKPSVYNGPTVYNTGADGGGGGGDNSVKIGSKWYRTCTIDGKIWLAENLNFEFPGCALNPGGIPNTPAAFYADDDFRIKYGLLYNWYAFDAIQNNIDNLIPGWHFPSIDDFQSLASFVGSQSGKKLRSNYDWTPNYALGTDDYGFTGIPAGSYFAGNFIQQHTIGNFWSSTEYDSSIVRYMYLWSDDNNALFSTQHKTSGYSLRLIKD